jgi:uncharacterized tellurite resistance protein B-like protein
MATRHELLADLLMAAAFADRRLEGREVGAVRAALRRATGEPALPAALEARIDGFRPAAFDLASTVAGLTLDDSASKRQLLELIAAVHEADDVTDLDEDAYLRAVAEALGVPVADYADLVIDELAVESIRGAWAELSGASPRRRPPPLPQNG